MPWTDFEWLSQIIFFFFYKHGGYLALLILKATLLFLCWIPIALGIKDAELPRPQLFAAFLFWATASISHSDLRPELFSLFFFAALLVSLERRKTEPATLSWRWILWCCAIFSLWANLHAGFIFGGMLFALYAATDLFNHDFTRFHEKALAAIFAVASTLINPYGIGPYRIAWAHLQERSNLSHSINEWEAFTFSPPVHWPVDCAFVALFFAAGLLAISARKRRDYQQEFPIFLLTLFLGILTLFYRRFSAYFIIAFILAGSQFLKKGEFLSIKKKSWPSMTAALLCSLYIFRFASHVDWKSPFDSRLVCRRATAFLSQERRVISSLRVYNKWEWGGYLGWKLRPWFKIYCDGRYLFHDLLFKLSAAVPSPDTWQDFLNSQNLNAALMPNFYREISTTRIYPDKTTRKFNRPWYLFFMPRKDWALVYWDDKALFFVKRGSVSPSWLKQHEYRLWHPHDSAALQDALNRREVSQSRLEKEQERHLREISLAPPCAWRFSCS